MAKGKQTKRKINKKKQTRKHRKQVRKIKGGDCGCNKSIMQGGTINHASFDGSLPKDYYYKLNDEINNPNTPTIQIAARNLPNVSSGGGKRRKFKGGSYTLLSSAYSANPLMTFGTIDGTNGVHTLTSTSQVNPNVIEQPIIQGYTNTNPPLA